MNKIRRRLFLVTLATWIASCVSAVGQTPATPTGVEILVLPPGSPIATGIPVGSRITTIGAAMPNCNIATLPPQGSLPLINPTSAYFDDPFTAGKFCKADMPTELPNAVDYIAVAVFQSAAGNSVRSQAGIPLFTVAAVPPPAPTHLVVRP